MGSLDGDRLRGATGEDLLQGKSWMGPMDRTTGADMIFEVPWKGLPKSGPLEMIPP